MENREKATMLAINQQYNRIMIAIVRERFRKPSFLEYRKKLNHNFFGGEFFGKW